MLYRMYKLSLGTGLTEPFIDVNINFPITSLYHIDKFGFLFIIRDHHFIIHSDYNGKITSPWMGEIDCKGDEDGTSPLFNYPSSICYYPPLNTCFLIENGGRGLRNIDIKSSYCGSTRFHNSFRDYFDKTDSIEKTETACDVDVNGNIYWVVKDLHRCFMKIQENNMVNNFIGNGRSGFSISNNLYACLLSHPSGIKCINNSIYIADSNNHCIRNINNDVIEVTFGNPLNNKILTFPSQIKGNNGIIYVLDKNQIKYFSLKDKNNGILYESPNIVAIETDGKKNLYILETL